MGSGQKRNQHKALDALFCGLHERRVNWVLDLDVRSFFDRLSHEWLVRFLQHRIADRRVVRLIQKWLNAGVLEKGKRTFVEAGFAAGRKCIATAGEHLPSLRLRSLGSSMAEEACAWRCDRGALRRRHRGWIRVQRRRPKSSGRNSRNEWRNSNWNCTRRRRGCSSSDAMRRRTESALVWASRRPSIFSASSTSAGRRRRGRFLVLRQTVRKRMQAKLQQVKIELRRRMHDPVPEVGEWLKSVVGGHIRYFGVPGNRSCPGPFSFHREQPLASNVCADEASMVAFCGSE